MTTPAGTLQIVPGEAPPLRLSLRHNFAWTFTGNVVYSGSQWGALILLARLGNPEMVGRMALALAVTAPVFMLTNLQLRAVQATDARREYAFGHYWGLRIVMTALALPAIAVIAFPAGYRVETLLVVMVIAGAKAVESLSDLLYGLFQQRERMDLIARSMMYRGPLSMLLIAAALTLTGSVAWAAAAMGAAWTAVLLGYDLSRARRLLSEQETGGSMEPIWALAPLRRLAVLALPLGVVMLLISLNSNIPRYVIERYRSEAELGVFAAMAYVMVAGNTVVSALGQSASPRLAAYYARADLASFRKLLGKLLLIGAALGAAGLLAALLCGEQLLGLLYGPDYAAQAEVFAWLMAAGGVSYIASLAGYGITAARYFRVQIPLFGTMTLLLALLSLALVPKYGAQGAAKALLAAAVVQLALTLVVVVRAITKPCKGETI